MKVAKLGKAPGPDGITAEATKLLRDGGVIFKNEISHDYIVTF